MHTLDSWKITINRKRLYKRNKKDSHATLRCPTSVVAKQNFLGQNIENLAIPRSKNSRQTSLSPTKVALEPSVVKGKLRSSIRRLGICFSYASLNRTFWDKIPGVNQTSSTIMTSIYLSQLRQILKCTRASMHRIK